MRAELRELMSVDAMDGLDAFVPADPRDFMLVVTATVGPPGAEGGDDFEFVIVGPDWFASNPAEKRFRWGRHYLIVDGWDAGVVRRAIRDVCDHAEGADWAEVATKVGRYGHWEFEDYRPYVEPGSLQAVEWPARLLRRPRRARSSWGRR